MKEGEKEMSLHRETVNNRQQNTGHDTDMGFSDMEAVTPPNLVTGFLVVNIGNSRNSANNDIKSPDTDTCFHVPN